MANPAYFDQVQEVYIAFYGRPADFTGMTYWSKQLEAANGDMTEIIDAFGKSPETLERYEGMSATEQITAIYGQLFNRQPDTEGLIYWLGQLQQGMSLSAVSYHIMKGALPGPDTVALAAKQAAADAFFAEFLGDDGIDKINAYNGAEAGAAARDWLQTVYNPTTAAEAVAGLDELFDTIINGPVDPAETLVLTAGQDVLTGGSGDDTFLATGATLNQGDQLDGGEGMDTLEVSISGSGVTLTSFDATSIEAIEVKSLATGASTIDLSDTSGVTELVSYETSGASLTFRDIQSVNDTSVTVIDTVEDHTFIYDLNAYDPSALDVVDLTLQEVRDRYDSEGNGPVLSFENPFGNSSQIDGINIHSLSRDAAGPTPATANYVQALNVGEDLDTINIDGDADLEIEEALDRGVRVINAGDLFADLTLDVESNRDTTGDGIADTFVYEGAHGRDNLDVERDGGGNNTIDLNDGNDRLDVVGDGNQLVTAGIGNDVVNLSGDGQNNVDLGEGNDNLTINGVVDNWNTAPNNDGRSTVVGGEGNDNVDINGILVSQTVTAGNYSIDLGEGNDVLDIDGAGSHSVVAGAGNDSVRLNGNGSNNVAGNEGNDSILIIGNGNQTVTAGTGNDAVDIRGDGDQSVQGNEGDDSVEILGSGVHNVNLGAGNDSLDIVGGRTGDGNMDNALNFDPTVIRGEGGNDTVNVTEDHYLDADLGEGNDSIQLRAKDLTSDDTVSGSAGNDRIILTNVGASKVDGRVLQSETIGTTGFETYDLRDSNITLALTDLMITTAENKDLTVDTTQAEHQELPTLDLVVGDGTVQPFHQGMTVAEFNAVAISWRNGDFEQSGNTVYSQDAAGLAEAKHDLVEWLLDQGLSVNFTDTTGDDDSLLIEPGDKFQLPANEATDEVWFILEQDGAQTIDMTPITTPQYNFTLLGGNIRDIVIGDDASINGRSILDFNSATGDALSAQDTLRVVDGAEITAADLRNVTGLERIELVSTGNAGPQEWTIQLTDIVINQTTGTADLVITVAPDVPAGSRLDIILDPSVVDATSDVKIFKNANVEVYINGDRVNEPELGDDFNTGNRLIQVFNQLNFTANADHLIGTDDDDVFTATSLDFIQAGDVADGNGGEDTLVVDFAPNNQAESLETIFNGANITEIEHLDFNTGGNVGFFGLGLGYMTDLRSITTDEGNDNLTLRAGLTLNLEDGDDTVSFATPGSSTVNGGSGEDDVNGSFGSDNIWVDSVEFIDGGNGNDAAYMQSNDSDTSDGFVNFWAVESVYGSEESDRIRADVSGGSIFVDGNSGNDTIEVGNNTPNSAIVFGGEHSDSVTVLSRNTATVYGDDNDAWDGDDGNDTIAVTISGGSGTASAGIQGEGGNDHIRFVTPAAAGTYPAANFYLGEYDSANALIGGGTGNDTIEAFVVGYNSVGANVTGGSGADNIYVMTNVDVYSGTNTVNILGESGNDTITYVNETSGEDSITIDGGSDDDEIYVVIDNAPTWIAMPDGIDPTILGGSGNDTIELSNVQPSVVQATASIEGGSGNDSIEVSTDGWTTTITGGEGNDTIDLQKSVTAGKDTLVFGNITYNGLQVENLNTQGTDTIKDFNFEEVGVVAGGESDVLDFSAFNGAFSLVRYNKNIGTTGDTDTGIVNVLSVVDDLGKANGYILTNANFADSGLNLRNDSEGVVILASDTDGQNGYDHFDVYFVQDVDSTPGVVAKVNLVGQIDSATNVGLPAIDANNFL